MIQSQPGYSACGSLMADGLASRSSRGPGSDHSPSIGATAATVTPKLGYRGEIVIDNLTYLRARNYDAASGVFTSRDPLDGVNGTAVVGTRITAATTTRP